MTGHTANVSHGRGGLGNIAPDPTPYEDGEIVRRGDPSQHGHAYSSGRGGAGNIALPHEKPATQGVDADQDIVPESAHVLSNDEGVYHTGRGGQGNVHQGNDGKHHKHGVEGLGEKIKRKLHGEH